MAGVVARWRNGRGSADDLGALAAMPYEEFAGIVANASTTGGHRKDLTVQRAAANLHRAGVTAHSDFDPDSDAQRHAYTRTPGCGAVTWSYLCMLLGEPDVKPDTQVMRFVDDALLRKVSPAQARVLLNGAASEIGIDARRLDHSIWAYQRSKHPHD